MWLAWQEKAAPIHTQMRAQDRTEMKDYEIAKLGPKPDDRPDSNDAIRMCVNAWNQLGADRPLGFAGAGAIPYTAIRLWAKDNDLDRDDFRLLCEVIVILDNERAIREASKQKTKGGKK